jgi:hypothetical protein
VVGATSDRLAESLSTDTLRRRVAAWDAAAWLDAIWYRTHA